MMTEDLTISPDEYSVSVDDVTTHDQCLKPDRAVIRRHMELLAPEGEGETLEIAYGQPEGGPRDAKRFTRDQLDDAVAFAVEKNTEDCNVYLGAASRTHGGQGRANASEFAGSQNLWADADRDVAAVEQLLNSHGIEPAFEVQTGSEPELRKHYYCGLNGPRQENGNEVRKGNKALQKLLGTDKAVVNPIQLLRLAGTINYPNASKAGRGYVAELTTLTVNKPVKSVDIDQLHKLAQEQERSTSKPVEKADVGQRKTPPVQEINEALSFILPKYYDQWIAVGMALKYAYGDEGFEIWDTWSKGHGAKYYPEGGQPDTRYKWNSFDASKISGKPITVGTVIHLARQNGWKGNVTSSCSIVDITSDYEGQDGVRLYTIGELLERQPPEFLIDDMLPAKSVAIIGGQSGAMKSFLMIHLSLMVALGKKVGQHSVKQTGVLFMINEGQAGFGVRCQAALTHIGSDRPNNFRVAEITPDLMRKETLDPFFEAAEALDYKPGLIVIDTFSKASIGGDDNSTSDMAKAINTAEQLASHFNALVVLIDHVGKDLNKGLRGAYSKYANAEMVGMVTKVSDTVTLKTTKQKEAEDGISFDFKVTLVKSTDKMAGEVRETPALSIRTKLEIHPQKEFIIKTLQQDGPTDRAVLSHVFCGWYGNDKRKSFNSQLSRLRNNGIIKVEDGCVQLVE
jgi:hypothetical protein